MVKQRPNPRCAVRAVEIARGAIARGAIQKRSEYAPFLVLVLEERPAIVLEIGRGAGGGLWALCQSSADAATIISVDLPGGPYGGQAADEETLATYRRYARAGQAIHLIQGNSVAPETFAAVKEVTDRVDLLFIDGDHRYEGVKADYDIYSSLVPRGGLIAFHDILHHDAFPEFGVDRLWGSLGDPKREIVSPSELSPYSHGRWGGIGVIRVP